MENAFVGAFVMQAPLPSNVAAVTDPRLLVAKLNVSST